MPPVPPPPGSYAYVNLILFVKIHVITPQDAKGSRNINKLIHRTEEELDLKFECILVSAMVHLPQE